MYVGVGHHQQPVVRCSYKTLELFEKTHAILSVSLCQSSALLPQLPWRIRSLYIALISSASCSELLTSMPPSSSIHAPLTDRASTPHEYLNTTTNRAPAPREADRAATGTKVTMIPATRHGWVAPPGCTLKGQRGLGKGVGIFPRYGAGLWRTARRGWVLLHRGSHKHAS